MGKVRSSLATIDALVGLVSTLWILFEFWNLWLATKSAHLLDVAVISILLSYFIVLTGAGFLSLAGKKIFVWENTTKARR